MMVVIKCVTSFVNISTNFAQLNQVTNTQQAHYQYSNLEDVNLDQQETEEQQEK